MSKFNTIFSKLAKSNDPCCLGSIKQFSGKKASQLNCNCACEGVIYVTSDYGTLEANTYYLCKDGSLTKIVDCTNSSINLSAATSDYTGYGVSCYGGNDGTINLTVSGGQPGYTYLWSNGYTGQDPSGLKAGIYTVLVTDSLGCTKSLDVEITQPDELVITIDSIVPESEPEAGDGAIYITVTGGIPSYIYTWTGSIPTQDLINQSAGLYTIEVVDQNGCTATIEDIEIPAA